MNPDKPAPQPHEPAVGENEYALLGKDQVTERSTRAEGSPHQGPHLHSEPDQADRELQPPLGDWRTARELADITGYNPITIRKIAAKLGDEHPEWFQVAKMEAGSPALHYHPEAARRVREELSQRKPAPEGWETAFGLSKELGVTSNTITKIVEELKEENPDEFRPYMTSNKTFKVHFGPEVVSQVRERLGNRESAPEGWVTNNGLSKMVGVGSKAGGNVAEGLREEHPEWFRYYKDQSGKLSEHYAPEAVQMVEQAITVREPAPEGWVTRQNLSEETGLARSTIRKLVATEREQHPEWFRVYKDKMGRLNEHYAPEASQVIREERSKHARAPEGWASNEKLARDMDEEHVGRARGVVRAIAETAREEHPEWFGAYRVRTGRVMELYSPELVAEIKSSLESRMLERAARSEFTAKREELNTSVHSFLSEVAKGETPEAQEFRKLIELFGANQAVDVLYKYRPEYTKIPVPEVKSALGDYLGDFLTIRTHFELDNLEMSTGYLADQGFKEGLTETIKSDCLRFYNQVKRTNHDENDAEIISAYLGHLRERAASFMIPDLAEVLDGVDNYYRSVFADVHKPESMVESLKEGRQFPDINQRINIREIELKNRVLIADEMGLGKSASAILAKESLGVEHALIVVPSNVIPVWLAYLSDGRGPNGELLGYFKEGQAPRVLMVDSPTALQNADLSAYDYVILAQERLTDKYVRDLEKYNYGMLVIDEMQKLKNIATGQRAERLLQLSERIEADEDKYLVLLSGTPVPNKISDVAMTLKLLYPEEFEQVPNRELTRQIIQGDILDLRGLLVPRMQQKGLGESVEMPQLSEKLHPFSLSNQEQEIYDILLEEDELTSGEKMQLLRQFILNPALLDVTPDVESSKIREVGEGLRQTFANHDKVVMFVNGYIEGVIRGETTIFEALGLPEGVEVQVIEGDVSPERRVEIQRNLRDAPGKILLAVSGQTADVGVDFSGADGVTFYNEPWTEYERLQEMGRVYRPGLLGDLTTDTYYAQGTIEEGMHKYIQAKYQAVEKLLRGIPISELEQNLVRKDEKRANPNLEVNPELAEYYFSSWDKMTRIYGQTKEVGEANFEIFNAKYGSEYADSYAEIGSRSYQANASRLSGTLIDTFVEERGQQPEAVRILDVASGPEILKKHIGDAYMDRVISIDYNQYHFGAPGQNRAVGSYKNLPIADKSIDYANLALSLHYSSFVPSRNDLETTDRYERLEIFKELNRVLDDGGRAVVSLMYTRGLKDEAAFREVIGHCGFDMVEEYSGEAEAGNNFRSRVITLEKTSDCPQDTEELVRVIGPQIKGLKFERKKASLKDSRKIVTEFVLGQAGRIQARFNRADNLVLDEEQAVLGELEGLKSQYGQVESIPRDTLLSGGFSRIFNGQKYILFKQLTTGSGAVVVR